MNKIAIVLITVSSVIFLGCSNSENIEFSENPVIKIDETILKIVSKSEIWYRNSELLVFRVFINEQCEYRQYLMRFGDEIELKKHGSNDWEKYDSQLSNEISQDLLMLDAGMKLMLDFGFNQISSTCNGKTIIFNTEKCKYYWYVDPADFKLSGNHLIRLNENWWYEKLDNG